MAASTLRTLRSVFRRALFGVAEDPSDRALPLQESGASRSPSAARSTRGDPIRATTDSDFFRDGGSLPAGAPCYVERPADGELLDLCRRGELAYVLAPRQSGKSSLVLLAQDRLRKEGVATAYVDLQTVGVQDVEAESWYLSVLVEVADRLDLGEGVEAWWRDRASLTPVKRFGDFLRQRVLQEVDARRIVVFFDEIELTTDLPFSADDFFTLIRGLTNARASEPELERLSFVLLGVAAPAELIADPKRTPFNVGRGVALEDLSPQAAKALLPGLAAAPEPQAVLDRVLHWTAGHPRLTQFLCRASLVGDPPSAEAVDTAVRGHLLARDGKADSTLREVHRQAERAGSRDWLQVYLDLLRDRSPLVDGESPAHSQLRLIGLARGQPGEALELRNRVYARVFDAHWANRQLDRRLGRKLQAPRVFLSYSHDSPEHQDRVLGLADRLRREGVDVVLDQYEPDPEEGWPRWMSRQIRESSFVLALCTAPYRRRFEGREKPGAGRGANWEGEILTGTLYEGSGESRRVLPCIFEDGDRAHIPEPLRSLTYYRLGDEAGYEALYRRITGQPEVERPALGTLRELTPRARQQSFPSDAAPAPPPVPAPPVTRRKEHLALVSSTYRHRGWVEALQANLERTLRHHGEERRILLDGMDLAPGRSWVPRLQEALAGADGLILVATPDALASPRSEEELERLRATRPEPVTAAQVLVVQLEDVPLFPFLAEAVAADFRHHDQDQYREVLARLAGRLLGAEGPVDLPPDLEIPEAPPSPLGEVGQRLLDWLGPLLESKLYRRAIASALEIERGALEGFSSTTHAASAALALATGDDEAKSAARRVMDVLADELGDDEADKVAELGDLRQALAEMEEATTTGEDAPSGLLEVYLERVKRDHSRLVPYFEERGGLELIDRVYVELQLRAHLDAEAAEKGSRIDGPSSLLDLLDLDPQDHPWVTGRWVVRGDPGSGKTTLLRHLAASLAGHAESTRRPWVPVFASLPRLLRDREWLLQRLARSLTRSGQPARALPAVLEREGREGRLLTLLDGLDEVPKDDRPEAEDLVRDLAARWPRSPLVVSTRPIGYRPLGSGFAEVDVLPLDGDRRLEFLARWFGRRGERENRERAATALEALKAHRSLWELSGNPLYLTLMALLLEEGRPLDRNRTRLYDQVFGLLLEGRHRPDGRPLPAQAAARAALCHLAFGMTRDNRDSEPLVEIEARLYQPEAEDVAKSLARVPAWRPNLRIFLEDVAAGTGILGPHDGADADWRYWHRTFREALAAEGLAAQLEAEGQEALLAHAREIAGDESRWAEPYALLAGRVEKADELVEALVSTNRPLGLRALATAQGLSSETLRRTLELSDNWQERAKVYLRVPELLGDAEGALALLDRLRQGTRNGNDLYFLERAVDGVVKLWPEEAQLAEGLRGRFFDHIPARDDALFESIETPKDGTVALWCEVPAGTYRVGSPEGEGDDDERPQHEVRLEATFHMAAVPVTNAMYGAFDSEAGVREWKGVPREQLPFHPRGDVTWFEAAAFCRWLGACFPWARGARLPTEEEWEIACRGATETRYWSGNEEVDLRRAGWYEENSEGHTHRCGEKEPNPFGLYDVHGNVWEWTSSRGDSYGGREERGLSIAPADVLTETVEEPQSGDVRVFRGGAFDYAAFRARSAYRGRDHPRVGDWYPGFRVLLPLPPRFEGRS